MLTKFKKIYAASRKWIIYANVILILAINYGGDYLASMKDKLLPAAIGCIILILYETLMDLESKLSVSVQTKDYATINDALPLITELVRNDKEETKVDIVAATGGTTLSSILPTIIKSSSASLLSISIHLINPESPSSKWFPEHWTQEVKICIDRIKKEITGQKINVTLYSYDYLPTLHGIMINKAHLFIGFFGWNYFSGANHLSGAQRLHRYYSRGDEQSEIFFDFFEDWLANSPFQLIYKYPDKGALRVISNKAEIINKEGNKKR